MLFNVRKEESLYVLNRREFEVQAKAVQIEEIYQEILDGKRSRFPPNTWKEDSNRELSKRVTKYLIETILKWKLTKS